MKFKQRTLITLSGCAWLLIGLFLLTLGINLLFEGLRNPDLTSQVGRFSILETFSNRFSDKQNEVVAILFTCLFIGYLKGRFVLAKAVRRQVLRILSLPNPAPLKYIYSRGYYLLLGAMIFLGIGMRLLPITPDTRGAIDVAIGSALMNGAMLYFRPISTHQSKVL